MKKSYNAVMANGRSVTADEILVRDAKLREVQAKLLEIIPEMVDAQESRVSRESVPKIEETIEEINSEALKRDREIALRRVKVFLFVVTGLFGLGMIKVNTVVPGLGTVVSNQKTTIRMPSGSVITRINFNEGDIVNRNDMVAQLSDESIRLELEKSAKAKQEIETQIDIHNIDIEKLNIDLRRKQYLLKRDVISKSQLENVKYALRKARKELEQLNTKHDSSALQEALVQRKLIGTRLISPVDGVFLTWNANSLQGQYLREGAEICEIGTLDRSVEVILQERDIKYVHAGNTAIMVFDLFPSDVFKGRVTKVAEVISESKENDFSKKTKACIARIEILGTLPKIVNGMHARVEIVSDNRDRLINRVFAPVTNFVMRKKVSRDLSRESDTARFN